MENFEQKMQKKGDWSANNHVKIKAGNVRENFIQGN